MADKCLALLQVNKCISSLKYVTNALSFVGKENLGKIPWYPALRNLLLLYINSKYEDIGSVMAIGSKWEKSELNLNSIWLCHIYC